MIARMNTTTVGRMRRTLAACLLVTGVAAVTRSAPSIEAAGVPHVVPRVECKIPSTGTGVDDTYWFSYTSDGLYNVPVGNSNVVDVYAGPTLVGSRTNQVVQFLPGNQVMAFSVQVAPTQSVRWAVTVALTIPESINPLATSIATTNVLSIPTCPAATGKVSAAVTGTPVISATNAVQIRNSAGLLTVAAVRFRLQGVSSVCTGSATPLSPLVLWGFGSGLDVEPVPAWLKVRTDTLFYDLSFGTIEADFDRTWIPLVQISDPQDPFTNSLGETYYGRSRVEVIADVYGRCRGADGRVYTSVQPYYVDLQGKATLFRWYTLGTPQTTSPIPEACLELNSGPTQPGCPYNGGFIGNGAARARR
jgi:hypothetical protein